MSERYSPVTPRVSLDRHELYELCVQAPAALVDQLVAIHGGAPVVLGEDFCGTAATSVAWTRRVAGGRAVAVDHDEAVLARAPHDDAMDPGYRPPPRGLRIPGYRSRSPVLRPHAAG